MRYRAPPTDSLETEEIPDDDGADSRHAWKVSGPFCAIVRPHGFVGWAKEHPSREEIETRLPHRSRLVILVKRPRLLGVGLVGRRSLCGGTPRFLLPVTEP